jgi:hypothetical protein
MGKASLLLDIMPRLKQAVEDVRVTTGSYEIRGVRHLAGSGPALRTKESRRSEAGAPQGRSSKAEARLSTGNDPGLRREERQLKVDRANPWMLAFNPLCLAQT